MPSRPAELRGRVFRGADAVASGLLTEDQLRSRAWRRIRQGVYADASLPVTHNLLTRAVALVMPPSAVFGGLTAAMLWGASGLASAADPVEVIVPPGIRWSPRSGVRVREAVLAPQDCVGRAGLRWTTRTRTGLDVVRRGALDDAVVLLDQLASTGVVRLDEVREAALAQPRGRGSRLAREAAQLADGLAESPQETRVRLLLLRAGLPAPKAQHRVFDDDGFVARVDFAWPELRVVVEYDGLWHAEPGQFARDRQRLNRLVAAGWRVIFVTAVDLYRPELLVARIAAALTP